MDRNSFNLNKIPEPKKPTHVKMVFTNPSHIKIEDDELDKIPKRSIYEKLDMSLDYNLYGIKPEYIA